MTIFDDHGRGAAQVNIVHEHDEQSADSTLQENAVAADVRRTRAPVRRGICLMNLNSAI